MSVFPGISATYWNTRATAPRRVKPFILAAIHITDNSGLMSAMNEAIYSNRVGTGASFTFVTNRNGTVVQCLHPEWQVPFTNGSWLGSNRNLWTVNHAISSGIGANDSTFMTIENVGTEPNYPISSASVEACAKLIAHGSKISGIPINRNTVLGHRDYDAYNRYNCPTRYNLEVLLGRIITRANQIKSGSTSTSTTRVGGLPVRFTPRTGWKATIINGKPLRSGATVSSSSYGGAPGDVTFHIWGEVAGQNFGYGSRWFFGPLWLNGAWRTVYIPLIDLKNRQF